MVKDGAAGSIPAGAPPQTSSSGWVHYPASCMLREPRTAVLPETPSVVVRTRYVAPGLTGLHHLLSHADDNRQAILDGHDDPGGHLRVVWR
jgi:hypothetical protein